ncbi:MAG: hypothetical protein JRH20_24650 [Deltaproteobacteria bacterium]|nr:hypothetical protein [Deltaproteobacteria bacterium]
MLLTAALISLAPTAHALDRAEVPVFRYVNAEGRPVYVNGLERVPKRYRKRAKALDLSRVSLNRKLGNELKREVDRRMAQLLVTDECGRRRAAVGGGFWRVLWRDHSPLVVIGGAMLLLLLITPWITRRIGGPRWSRVLMMVLPILVLAGLWSTSAVQASRTLSVLEAKARPCQRETYTESRAPDAVKRGEAPTLRDQWWMLEKLEADVKRAHEVREKALEAIR